MPAPPRESSLTVFRRHIIYSTLPDGTASVDASAIHSVATYNDWLESRGSRLPVDPAKVFKRTLTAHLSGTDGRVSFAPEEEAAILEVLRHRLRELASGAAASGAEAAAEQDSPIAFKRSNASPLPTPKKAQGAHRQTIAAVFGQDSVLDTNLSKPAVSDVEIIVPTHSSSPMPPPNAPLNTASHSTQQLSTVTMPEVLMQSEDAFLPLLDEMDLSQLDSFSHLLSTAPGPEIGLLPIEFSYRAMARPPSFLSARVNVELPQSPTIEQAIHFISTFQLEHTEHAVLVLNTLAGRDLSNLLMAQSDSSVLWIGAVARSHVGVARRLICVQDLPDFVRSLLLLALSGIGGEIDILFHVVLVDGVEQLMQLKMKQGVNGLVCVGARIA